MMRIDGSVALTLGGRTLTQVTDDVRRYCGLEWSGGPPETWAYRYFDMIETNVGRVEPTDVVAASALHPGISREDLGWFHDNSARLDRWINKIPTGIPLDEVDVEHVKSLSEIEVPSLTLLSKVLHRKRPAAVPMVDRHILDLYRPITGERRAKFAWPSLVEALRNDLVTNRLALDTMIVELEDELDRDLSALRICDIAIWMEATR